MSCSSPISWLRLERYNLREVDDAEHDAIVKHLKECEACVRVLARITTDEEERELPLLEKVRVTPVRRRQLITGRTAAIVSGLTLAAVVLIALGRRRPHEEDAISRWKGASVSFALVREDEAIVPEGGGVYHDGERFKALVTCPPPLEGSFDLVVFEQGSVSFPLKGMTDFACGNSVPMPGAFRVTGHERMTVCLVWRPSGGIDRDSIRSGDFEHSMDAGASIICRTLEPATPDVPTRPTP